MARPQSGVNGSMPQQSFGYLSINNQVPRGHNQSVYGYPEMSQMVPTPFLPQGYTTPHGHNAANNIRPVAQPQYTIFQYPSQPPNVNYQSYSYVPNFTSPQQYMYPFDVQAQVPTVNNYPTSTRKLNPLIVVDPTNNTGIDLSKYQSQSESINQDKKPKGLIDTPKLNHNERLIAELKLLESNIENRKEAMESENIKNSIQIQVIQDTTQNMIIFENTREIQENIQNSQVVSDIQNYDTENIMQTKIVPDITQSDNENLEIKPENTEEIKVEQDIIVVEQDAIKLESLPEKHDSDSNIQDNNNEDENQSLVTEKTLPNYFLKIDKKESDETILRRKLIYDREYLISLKAHSQSKKKPLNLPSTTDFSEEIIYSESQNISWTKPESSSSNQLSNDKFSKKQAPKYQGNSRNKFQKMFQPKLINLDIGDVQVLERSKSSYLPPQLRTKDKEIDAHVELKRNIKCNLNKITPQNFQDCLLEINNLNIKEQDEMSCLIGEIFIKAVQEEAYSVTYAQFCNKLSAIYAENKAFKSQLLKKCQEMFQTPIQEQLSNVRKEWILKIDNEDDAKMKSLYESDLEEQVKKAKDRYFGNIRFIGELFLHHLLAGKVILNCIIELLKGINDTDALLALCKLMETCGKQIDERHKDQMNTFIRSMDELSNSKDLETRIRFKLKDIVDMRQRDWTLRHIQQEKKINPQTMEEQKEEAAAEAANKLAASQAQNKKSHHNVQNNPVVRRQISTQHRPLAVKNLTCSTHIMDEKTILGPTRSNWTAGSGAKSKQRDQDSWTLSQKYVNNSRSPDQSPQLKIKNRYRPLESSAEGSGADSRSSTPPITHPKNINILYTTKKEDKLLSDNERATLIFTDLMSTNKFDIDNWSQIVDVKPIIEKWIDDMMEKDACCRRSLGDSFATLIKDKIISTEQLVDGTHFFVSITDDLIHDIPKLWDFLAEFLERFIMDKNSDINFFQHIFKSLLPNNNVALCLSKTLHAASSRLGHNIVGQVFHKSKLKWDQIVPNNSTEFVLVNSLQFTTAGGARLSQCGGHSLPSIAEELDRMLASDVSNEGIFEYLENNIDKPTWKSIEFTRTITSCILKSIKRIQKSNITQYLNDKSEIIRRFSQNKPENEIEVLRSVLTVADQFNKEILTIIYDVIMTGNIVSNAAIDSYLTNSSFKSESNFDVTYQILSQLCSLSSRHR